ncbi:GNAT family N-acetyltransferase [Candidatus Gracilibacteria bacterium]|nr:GNAT family N-acetyltransferase [Candidatus Gracilibacteria bacterium]
MNAFSYLTSITIDLLSLTIEGDRLRLVTISDEFEQDIFQEFTDEITIYMLPSPAKDIEETRSFIAKSRDAIAAGNNLQFAILSKTKEEFLGCCGLHGEEKIRTPELGIWLKKNAHGSGYGREAIHTLVNWSRKNIDLDYFIYPVDRRNITSRKIPESLGGKIIEEFTVETLTGKFLDEVVYKIIGVISINLNRKKSVEFPIFYPIKNFVSQPTR